MIERGRRVFLKVAEIGEVNGKGKAVLSFGFKGKAIAEADRPLATLVVPLMEEVIRLANYSSGDALNADLAAFRQYVDGLGIRAKQTTKTITEEIR